VLVSKCRELLLPIFEGVDLPKKPVANTFNPFPDDEEDDDGFSDFNTAAP
jgi:hypothetical protein